ncbi:hypothetical protein GCM10023115_27040 [Pontixanthobacter gangjinensis]
MRNSTTGCISDAINSSVTVFPAIGDNSIVGPQTICPGSVPAALTGSTPSGGDGSYAYVWESSTSSASSGFTAASGTNNSKDYSPGILSQTTWFKRKVNSANCAQNESNVVQITVEDTTPPNIDVQAVDKEVECDGAGNASDLQAWLNSNGGASASDNCGGVTWSNNYNGISDECGSTGSVTVTFTATDSNNKSNSTTATFFIKDTTPPAFVEALSGDDTVECDAVPAAETLTATDNCGSATVSFNETTTAGNCGGDYTLTRVWTATDECGLTTSHTQTITVEDTTPPTGTVPADITGLECIADVPVADIEAITDEADNCGGAVTVTVADTDNGGAGCNGDPYIVTRTYTLTDCGGLTTDLVQTITVEDTTPPTGTVPADITGLECIADVPVADIEAITDEADNCGGAVTVTVADTDNGGAGCNGDPYIITRTYTLTDCGGLTTDLVQTITVEDKTAPNLGAIESLDPVAVNQTFTIQAPSTGDNCSGLTATWYFNPDGNFDDYILNGEIIAPIVAPFEKAGIFNGNFVQGTFDSSIFETSENPTGTGVYSVLLVISDACGNESLQLYDYLVIYDPSGGFVTGGGWITSKPGDYTINPSATGKANFGFNAKYKTGKNNMTEVDGNTNFQFKEGDFHFKSFKHDDMSLVISGNKKATYRGSGTVNGSGDHKFMVTVIDGHATGGDGIDRFRIKVWSSGSSSSVIYDNEGTMAENADATTEIGGGSIVIHKPKGGGNTKTMESAEKVQAQVVEAEAPIILNSLEVAPNPMQSDCEIRFSLKERLKADLLIFDMNGRQLRSLHSAVVNANELVRVRFDRGNLPSGVYICKLVTGNGQSYERQIIID